MPGDRLSYGSLNGVFVPTLLRDNASGAPAAKSINLAICAHKELDSRFSMTESVDSADGWDRYGEGVSGIAVFLIRLDGRP